MIKLILVDEISNLIKGSIITLNRGYAFNSLLRDNRALISNKRIKLKTYFYKILLYKVLSIRKYIYSSIVRVVMNKGIKMKKKIKKIKCVE